MITTVPTITKVRLKGVIFDMDGVLVDSHPGHLRAWTTFFREFGINLSNRDHQYILDGHKRSEILRHFLGELPEEKIVFYGSVKDRLFSVLDTREMPGIPEILEDLKAAGLKLAVATSASERRARGMLASAGLIGHFDAIVTGAEVTSGKPNPALFLLAARKLNIAARNLLVIEDAPSGAEGARAAGMQCLGISGPEISELLCAAGARVAVSSALELSVEALLKVFPEFSLD